MSNESPTNDDACDEAMLPPHTVRQHYAIMRDFQKFIVWQKAHRLALETHRALAESRESGAAATRNQLQRAVASIPANIAEGAGKRSDIEFARYLDISLGSVKEAENHLLFARDMGWLSSAHFIKLDDELTEVRRMLFAFARKVRGSADRDARSS